LMLKPSTVIHSRVPWNRFAWHAGCSASSYSLRLTPMGYLRTGDHSGWWTACGTQQLSLHCKRIDLVVDKHERIGCRRSSRSIEGHHPLRSSAREESWR
jgi:hypothetical protein